MFSHFMIFSIFGSLALASLIAAQDQSGFISIDCGLPKGQNYTESTTGINYVSDEGYIETGESNNVIANPSDWQKQMWTVRSFPEGIRNCYRFILRKGDRYLIKATFMYANYDGKNEIPQFDMHLGPNYWGTVKFQTVSDDVQMEIVHVLQSNYLYVCLVNTGNGTPFISALGLRLLNNVTYVTHGESLELERRYDVGLTSKMYLRFKDDVYDRLWLPSTRQDWTAINTSKFIEVGNDNPYLPPLLAMRTAGIPKDANGSLTFFNGDFDRDPNAWFYIYMHFAELEELQSNQSRIFNIYLDGIHWGPFSPRYLKADILYSTSAMRPGRISINKTLSSTHPPILNALEIYRARNFSEQQTLDQDADAVVKIKTRYGLERNWQGDPCAPQRHLWNGIECSYNGQDQPTITSL